MGNVISYLKWRGDLNFKERSFCEVDNLALAMFSGIFNRSKHAIGFSGTLVGVCILAGMMGMFGSLGIDSLENFKYATLFTLYDYTSVLSSGDDWIMKAVAAGVIALVGYIIGSVRFSKKDLPL